MNGAFSPAKLAFDEWVGTFALHWKAKASSFSLLFVFVRQCVYLCEFGELSGVCVWGGGEVMNDPDLQDLFSAVYN